MSYIENVFICLAAPVLIAVLCLKGTRRGRMIFLFSGMTACFFTSYITTYLSRVIDADTLSASIEIAPFVEEIIKFIPLLYYLLVYTPKKAEVPERVLMVSVGFATFENVCYLVANGSDDLFGLMIRGFGTGAMHVICGTIVSAGVIWLWGNRWLQVAGTVGLLAVAITFHGVFNLLVSKQGEIAAMIGYFIPLLMTAMVVIIKEITGAKIKKMKKNEKI